MDATAKQQVVERLKQAQNVLVTVSNNPSVDQLAACIGLTLLLNKLGKHCTAVFSGQVPSTIEFLQPEKTLERNTDSLRDFIISLDKEKADKLRYKVEDQVVKIFITPYRTSLSDKDLVFSQGDFNVEAVIALGVKDKSQLDAAITAHGRILHDATVISVNSEEGVAPDIGQINWQEPTASSLSEMLVSISESFGANLIDNQMATAFLTGIVSETKRFSNARTSPKVMTMSAQLMAAGANQQLIVSKLEPPKPPESEVKPAAVPPADEKADPEGVLSVVHDKEESIEAPEPTEQPKAALASPQAIETEAKNGEINIDNEGNLHQNGQEQPAEVNVSDRQTVESETRAKNTPPDMPGSHAFLTPQKGPVMSSAFSATSLPDSGEANDGADPLAQSSESSQGFLTHAPKVIPASAATTVVEANQLQSPAPATSVGGAPHVEKARSAVESAFAGAPYSPDLEPVAALNALPLPDVRPPAPPSETVPGPEQKPEPKDDKPAAAAPPPVPPPLMPHPGIVIPSAPFNAEK